MMKNLNCLLAGIFILLVSASLHAEGTKQFKLVNTDFGNLEINDQSRPFALESNTNPLHRLYFRINNTTEKALFGFQHVGAGNATFRIKDPNGNVVYARTAIPTTGVGYITNYSQATIGPKVGGVPAGGYSPFTYQPTMVGDFYMEFTTDLAGTYHFDLFDLTVTTSTNTPINGRLWSYAWDLSTRGGTNAYNGTFFVYTDEGYVSSLYMNGIQPYGFVVSSNNTGPQNTGNITVDRRSVTGNSTRPMFKVFLNNPDPVVYPSAPAPVITSPIQIVGGNVYYGNPVQFTIGVSNPGTVQIIISCNGVAGYQPNTNDTIIAVGVIAGNNTITWNGRDRYNVFPTRGTTIEISYGFSAGITHLPIYDPEQHPNGFVVNRVRPGSGSAPIRWDDTGITGGTFNITGGSGNGHVWPTNFGDIRTINTWWNGFEIETSTAFTVIVQSPLPVSMLNFSGKRTGNNDVKLSWATGTETNNNFFSIERSADGRSFEMVGRVAGNNNSNTRKNYNYTDRSVPALTLYYRLRQTDNDGTESIPWNTIAVDFKQNNEQALIFPNPGDGRELHLKIPGGEKGCIGYEIVSLSGAVIFKKTVPHSDEYFTDEYIVFENKLPAGIYALRFILENEVLVKQLLIK